MTAEENNYIRDAARDLAAAKARYSKTMAILRVVLIGLAVLFTGLAAWTAKEAASVESSVGGSFDDEAVTLRSFGETLVCTSDMIFTLRQPNGQFSNISTATDFSKVRKSCEESHAKFNDLVPVPKTTEYVDMFDDLGKFSELFLHGNPLGLASLASALEDYIPLTMQMEEVILGQKDAAVKDAVRSESNFKRVVIVLFVLLSVSLLIVVGAFVVLVVHKRRVQYA
ncbi:MAG: hypothetical protein MHM6MM_007980, partial [Cercozoa sp. M6MM]